MKRIISVLLVLTMLVGMLPVFAVASNAADISITVDGDISDWANVKGISIAGSGDYAGKKATWYGVLTDAGLYLACDAYHDVYTDNGPSWWESTNFEFFLKYPSQRQFWVSAKDGVTASSGDSEIKEYKMNNMALEGAETNYRTITEVFVESSKFPADAVANGAIQVGFAWKTIGDDCNNGGNNANADNWWSPAGTTTTGAKKAYVGADGAYTIAEWEHKSSSFTFGGEALTGYTANGGWKVDANGALTAIGGDGDNNCMFIANASMKAGKISATLDRSANTASHDGIVFGATGTDTWFWEGGARYYFMYLTGTELAVAKTGNGVGWQVAKRADAGSVWDGSSPVTLTAEYDENGRINCYVNGTLLISLTDSDALGGVRFGLRTKFKNVKWTSLTATPAEGDITTAFDNEVELPIASWTGNPDLALKGYSTQGAEWAADGKGYTITDTSAKSNSWCNVFVISNDRMPLTSKGSLTATLTGRVSSSSNANDNGIIFGLEADSNVTVWESGWWSDQYYFLYVGDNNNLILAKPGNGWTTLVGTADNSIEGYSHGTEVTIKAEFEPTDNGLLIKGYANGVLLIEYTDTNPLTGMRYGIRSEVDNVVYTSLVAEHEEYVEKVTETLLTSPTWYYTTSGADNSAQIRDEAWYTDADVYGKWNTTTNPTGAWGTDDQGRKNQSLWLVTEFNIEDASAWEGFEILMTAGWDDNVRVYLNGNLVFINTGWSDGNPTISLTEKASELLVDGTNVLAVKLVQGWGGASFNFVSLQITNEANYSNPYEFTHTIEDADDLVKFAEDAVAAEKAAENSTRSWRVQITADIDMTGKDWTPLGKFVGWIYGNGHTIKGITYNVTDENVGTGEVGLFIKALANGDGNGRLVDLNFENCTLNVNTTQGEVTCGIVAGLVDRGIVENVTINNCSINGNAAYAGGIAGVACWGADDKGVHVENCGVYNSTINASVRANGVLCFARYSDRVTMSNATVINTTLNAPAYDLAYTQDGNSNLTISSTTAENNTRYDVIDYASDTNLYIQSRDGANGTKDHRVIVVASEETLAAKDSCVFSLTFTYTENGEAKEKTVTKEITKAYLEILAKDSSEWNTIYTVADGYAILGIVITGVPADATVTGSASYN